MKNRREFLKGAATGALLLGSQSKLGLAKALDKHSEQKKSKVVVAHDAALHGSNGQLDEKRLLALLDHAIASYTGRDNMVEAWKQIVPVGKVIGLKVNGQGGRGISTHGALVMAIAERLQQAGVKPGEIVIWDTNARQLEACGLKINTDPSHVRCFGTNVSGFEEQPVSWGTVKVNLAKILTRECAMVINVPILKDHAGSGITFAMKNIFGGVEVPHYLHANNFNPSVADLNCIPVIRNKVRFIVGDAITSVYNGGPGFRPQFLWKPNELIVGEDRVAVDYTALKILDRKRVEVGMKTIEAAGYGPRWLATAANAEHHLGVDDPQRIHLVEV